MRYTLKSTVLEEFALPPAFAKYLLGRVLWNVLRLVVLPLCYLGIIVCVTVIAGLLFTLISGGADYPRNGRYWFAFVIVLLACVLLLVYATGVACRHLRTHGIVNVEAICLAFGCVLASCVLMAEALGYLR